MPPTLPFTLRRQSDVFDRTGITSTTDTVHGLLRLDGDQLVVQWRVHRDIDLYGEEVRTDRKVDDVREAIIPVALLSGVTVRRPWWAWRGASRFVLTAADLRAFEPLVGPTGLKLPHPAQLILRLGAKDREAGIEFGADLELAMGDLAMRLAAGSPSPESRPRTSTRSALPEET